MPLNERVFEALARGINKYTADEQPLNEEVLYRAFSRAIQEIPEQNVTFVATLNDRIIAQEVLKEQENQSMRFSPVALV